jgi:hypothetical protein
MDPWQSVDYPQDIEVFLRPPLPNEPTTKESRTLRYCAYPGCTWSSFIMTNIKSHMRKHGAKVQDASSKIRLDASIQLEDLLSKADDRTREKLYSLVLEKAVDKSFIRQALVRYIIKQRLSFSVVKDPAFHAFAKALNPIAAQWIPTSHNTIRVDVIRYWTDQKIVLVDEIRSANSNIHIALDVWTSPNRILLLGTTAHFVQHVKKSVVKRLLALRPISGHSGEDQFQVLRTILEEYQIGPKLGSIIGDNSTTNDTLCRTIAEWQEEEFEVAWDPERNRIRCLGHIINLIVQAFLFTLSDDSNVSKDEAEDETQEEESSSVVVQELPKVMDVLSKLHSIVVHIRSSGVRTAMFQARARRMIPLDNSTRWNSWFDMVSVALDLEMEVDHYIKKHPDLEEKALSLNNRDWEMLRTIATFLSYFKKILLQNEGDSQCLAQTLPSMWLLNTHIKAFKVEHMNKDRI